MAYFGKQDKKSIVHLLDNGLAMLKENVTEGEKHEKTLWGEFNQLEKVLYGEGTNLLSTTNKIRFEKRLNTIRKRLEKAGRD